MIFRNSVGWIGWILAIVLFVMVSDADAYIDPGTGSYILQIAIAAVLGALFAVKMFWKNVKSFLTGILHGRDKRKHGD